MMLKFSTFSKTFSYQSTTADHTKILYQRIFLDGFINFERWSKQAFAQMSANRVNFPHENAARF